MTRRRRLALHATGVVLVPLCLAAGLFELHRALSGNALSWAYTVEWPVIAGYGVHVWRRLLAEADGVPAAVPRASTADAAEAGAGPDEGLAAWQAYLAALHAADPPGGPDPVTGR